MPAKVFINFENGFNGISLRANIHGLNAAVIAITRVLIIVKNHALHYIQDARF